MKKNVSSTRPLRWPRAAARRSVEARKGPENHGDCGSPWLAALRQYACGQPPRSAFGSALFRLLHDRGQAREPHRRSRLRQRPKHRFKNQTRRNRLTARTAIGNVLLRKVLADAFPFRIKQSNHPPFIADRLPPSILRMGWTGRALALSGRASKHEEQLLCRKRQTLSLSELLALIRVRTHST